MQRTLPILPCMCASLRRASRALTQHYEDALRPFDLTTSQFTILQALSMMGEVTQGDLARVLAMDSTTLTRTLRIMERHGWLAKRAGKDRRAWWLSLARGGRRRFEQASIEWERVQAELRRELGEDWNTLMNLSDRVTMAVTE
jgi:DNA-binding MarR family transcriptional regulator